MPIHPEKLELPKEIHPPADKIRELMEATITRMRDKPVVNVRLVGLQQITPLTIIRGRFKEDFAYEKGFLAVLLWTPSGIIEIKDLIIVPGFEE